MNPTHLNMAASNLSNSLFFYLAILGGVFLVGVVLHGAWAARKAGPKRPEDEDARAAEPQEPTLSPEPGGPQASVAGPERAGEAAAAGAALLPTRRPEPRLDARIDALARISLDQATSGDAVLAHLPPSRRAGSKYMGIEALRAEDGVWETPQMGVRYTQLQLGVQMANRHGAINEIEYSEFAQRVQGVADALGGLVDLPDMLEVVAKARALDAFASGHDAQLVVHLRARSAAWSLPFIQQHAARHGFVAGVLPGRMVLPASDEGGPPMLLLSFDAQAALAEDPSMAAVHDVTLSFDVPQTEESAQPFSAWQASALALSMGMDAAIVDDAGHALTAPGFAAIGAELVQVYQALAKRELPAGAAVTRRLFS